MGHYGQLIKLSKNIQYKPEDLELLNKILSNSMKKKLAFQLKGTGNKLKVIDNRTGENKDFPEGYIIELYNNDNKLMMQMTQDYNYE